MWRIMLVMGLMVIIAACTEGGNYAPVTEVSTIEPLPKNHIYYVQTDDTLYSIAWRYGLDYRTLAKINHVAHPYHIEVGQPIYLSAKHVSVVTPTRMVSHPKPVVSSTPMHVTKEKVQPIPVEKEPTLPVSHWQRPATGPIIGAFSGTNKGTNFGGKLGDPIFATAAGKVVYSGDGLKAYGNLIILKHNSIFLSAYAYNSRLLVKEGEWVHKGQKIAEMGNTGSRQVMLHFEIRRNGKPVNPMNYIS